MDFFKILNGGIGVSMSNFDRLWAKKFSGWPETELNGLLPLTFLAEGSDLTDYRIYGTESGAGVQTESGEPAGYKIPLTVTSGQQSTDYDLFIGDTKLGAEEYIDFAEQKIYRTILLTTHDNKAFITSDNKRICVRRSNNV